MAMTWPPNFLGKGFQCDFSDQSQVTKLVDHMPKKNAHWNEKGASLIKIQLFLDFENIQMFLDF